MTALEKLKNMAAILDSKKAEEIVAFNVSNLTILGDYFLIASARSTTLASALAGELENQMSKLGQEPRRKEGYNSASWILLDYSDVIVHIFYKETRDFYSLERLWADAPQVDLTGVVQDNA